MEWSYSRLSAFEPCCYKWFLKYIKKIPSSSLFFSDYGKFIHKVIQLVLIKEISKEEAPQYYISGIETNITGKPPNAKVYENYLRQGLSYFQKFDFPYEAIEVEKEVHFQIDGHPFIGFIDVLSNKEGLILIDHKSRDLKPRSKKAVKSNGILDSYLRQLYLYSIPIYQIYGEYPSNLVFNCFRSQTLIAEPFSYSALEDTIQWALNQMSEIKNCESWIPWIDYFPCSFLCDVNYECEYYQTWKGGG